MRSDERGQPRRHAGVPRAAASKAAHDHSRPPSRCVSTTGTFRVSVLEHKTLASRLERHKAQPPSDFRLLSSPTVCDAAPLDMVDETQAERIAELELADELLPAATRRHPPPAPSLSSSPPGTHPNSLRSSLFGDPERAGAFQGDGGHSRCCARVAAHTVLHSCPASLPCSCPLP